MPDLHALGPQDALIIVDLQRDFCPGGSLAIDEGDKVVSVLNQWIDWALVAGSVIVASRDWHPATHMSFKSEGGPWPPHCVQDTPGARFHPALQLPSGVWKVTKGVRFDKDQYSAFDETGLAHALRLRGIRRVWIGGLALDVCVKATARDAVAEGFETHVICQACRPVTTEGGAQALADLRTEGAHLEP